MPSASNLPEWVEVEPQSVGLYRAVLVMTDAGRWTRWLGRISREPLIHRDILDDILLTARERGAEHCEIVWPDGRTTRLW